MVRSGIVVFLLGVNFGLGESSFVEVKVNPSKEYYFREIYNYIRENVEGNYVNHPGDKGGETYGGIARRMHPNWLGWSYIDKAKPLKRHQKVDNVEFLVLDFYVSIWVKEGFEVLENKEIALNLFDFRIHSSPKTVQRKINRVLDKLGKKPIKVRGEWVTDEFNDLPAKEFVLLLKIERLKLFNYLVAKDPNQAVFYEGWVKRIENI